MEAVDRGEEGAWADVWSDRWAGRGGNLLWQREERGGAELATVVGTVTAEEHVRVWRCSGTAKGAQVADCMLRPLSNTRIG